MKEQHNYEIIVRNNQVHPLRSFVLYLLCMTSLELIRNHYIFQEYPLDICELLLNFHF